MMYADSFCNYKEEFNPHAYVFTGKCVVTGQDYSVRVLGSELFRYRQGVKIQEAMKSLSSDDREFLQSGISPEGWERIFGEKE